MGRISRAEEFKHAADACSGHASRCRGTSDRPDSSCQFRSDAPNGQSQATPDESPPAHIIPNGRPTFQFPRQQPDQPRNTSRSTESRSPSSHPPKPTPPKIPYNGSRRSSSSEEQSEPSRWTRVPGSNMVQRSGFEDALPPPRRYHHGFRHQRVSQNLTCFMF